MTCSSFFTCTLYNIRYPMISDTVSSTKSFKPLCLIRLNLSSSLASIPSLGIVLAFSGLTYAKKDKYKFHQLGKVVKKDSILGGWIGTMIGIMLTFGLADNSINNNFGDLLNSIGMAMITLLYGYMIGNIVESFCPEKE